jgi:hypothetical protein
VEIPDARVFLDIDRAQDVEPIARLLKSRQPPEK